MIISATGMGLVGTFLNLTTAGLDQADKSVIGSFFLSLWSYDYRYLRFLDPIIYYKEVRFVPSNKDFTCSYFWWYFHWFVFGMLYFFNFVDFIANAVFLIWYILCSVLFWLVYSVKNQSVLWVLFLFPCVYRNALTIGIISENGIGLDLGSRHTRYA